MTDSNKAVMLYSSTNGMIYNAMSSIEMCSSCGKRTLICPHKYTQESIIELPANTSHLKCLHIEPDMRLTISTERNTRMTKVLNDTKFCMLEVITSLEDIWEEIGIKEDQRELRSTTVFKHIEDLLKEMLADEEDLRSKMKLSVEEYRKELDELCKDLGLPPKQIPTNMSLLQLEGKLRNDVDTLNKEKHDRVKTLKRLRADEQLMCDRMVLPQHELNFEGCPTLEQLRELEQNVKFLKSEKSKRADLFKKLQATIKQLWTDLDIEPVSSLELSMCAENAEEEFILSTENLESLSNLETRLREDYKELVEQIEMLKGKVKSLWERLDSDKKERNSFLEKTDNNTPKVAKLLMEELKRLEELKRQHMRKFIDSIRAELVALWDQCYFGEEQRQVFRPFYSDVFTEETLAEHEHQAATVKDFYQENKEIFKLVDKRENLWMKKLEFENRSTDLNRLNNRGGALLKEEKMRKAVEKELPKIEADIKKKLKKWENENETYFTFKGLRYIDYLDQQKIQYDEEQKIKKEEKARAKLEEISQEAQFGSKSSKRKMPATPNKMNAKVPRMNATQTPTRFVHSSICPSPKVSAKENKTIKNKYKSSKAGTPKILKKANKVKTDTRRMSLKRRSIRLLNAKKALKEQNGNNTISTTVSDDTTKFFTNNESMKVVSGSSLTKNSTDLSLISYNDFTNAVAESPYCRSSFLCNRNDDRTPLMMNTTTTVSSINRKSTRSTTGNRTLNERAPKMKF